MSQDVLMPALSPTMEEGALARWHVKPGDTVRAGDVIAEIETDKATMEVEAVDEGTVEALLVDAGTQGVKVGTAIARLSGEGAPAASAPPPPETLAPSTSEQPKAAPEPASSAPSSVNGEVPPSPAVRRIAVENDLDLSTVKGTGREGRVTKGDGGDSAAGFETGLRDALSFTSS